MFNLIMLCKVSHYNLREITSLTISRRAAQYSIMVNFNHHYTYSAEETFLQHFLVITHH